jgi:hypothetical protein
MERGDLQVAPHFSINRPGGTRGCDHGNESSISGRLDQCILEKHMNVSNDNSASAPRQQNILLKTPYGELRLEDAMSAHDHASMRAEQLKAFLVLIGGEGRQNFSFLSAGLQTSLLWMLQQSACELHQLLSQVSFTDLGVAK